MPQVLNNNEVDILNVANIDNDIRDSYTRAMIAGEEKETYCTRQGGYDINEFFIWTDRQIYKTKAVISQGDTFVLNTNIELAGTLSDQMYQLFSQSPESMRAVLSNIESGSTASRNFVKGEYILWTDGFLYEVTANTNIGTAWAVGTNITKKNNITDEITSINSDLSNEVSKTTQNGAHNLLRNVGVSQVFNDITWTVYPDGHIHMSGTVTNYDNSYFTFANGDFGPTTIVSNESEGQAVGNYRLYSGLPNGGTVDKRMIYNSIDRNVYINVNRGQTVDDDIYPMITLASDTDPTYRPFTKTNRTLTENVIDLQDNKIDKYLDAGGGSFAYGLKTLANQSEGWVDVAQLIFNPSLGKIFFYSYEGTYMGELPYTPAT